jgi:hypothetical protein
MFKILLLRHRVDRVPGFFLQSYELGPQASAPPPLVPGGAHSLGGEGVVGPNSDEGAYTVVL